MSSPSRPALLTVCISAAGILSLSLADLLPWSAFAVLLIIHAVVLRNFSIKLRVPEQGVVLLTIGVLTLESLRVFLQGSTVLVQALRDVIVLFSVVRLIMPKTGREIYQIIGISITECILSTIFTQSPAFLIGLVVLAALVPIALSDLDEAGFGKAAFRREPVQHWPKVWAGIIITSSILFFIIPRPSSTIIPYEIASHPRTGYSEEVHLSHSSSIYEDDEIVMRIMWEGGRAPELFYLSGSRLDALTEKGFTKGFQAPAPFIPRMQSTDSLLIYPSGLDTLNVFYPFHLSNVSPASCVRKGLNIYWVRNIPPVYRVWVEKESPKQLSGTGTYVPQDLAGVAELARRIAGDAPAATRTQRLADYLKSRCTYTLDALGIPENVSPIPWFVFDGRRGNCEHFASSLAVMLRGCGIPARVVTGFLVHEFNTSGGYFIVRARNAHAWVEYFDGGTWNTLEATPQTVSTMHRESSIIDAMRFTWIRWVIQYSLDDQIRLTVALFSGSPVIEHEVGYVLAGSVGAALFMLALWLIYLGMKERRAGLYRKVMRALAARGLELAPGSSHEEHLDQVEEKLPSLRKDFHDYLDDYLAWRFGERAIDMRSKTYEIIRRIKDARSGR